MVRLVALLALAACVRGDYRCERDSDCDVGADGRCELDHRCTVADTTCPLGRRYAELAGTSASQCYDNAREPLAGCAAGQPPALPTGCYQTVCEAVPACCETGWSDACVQLAQLHCETTCPLSMAVTVDRNDGFVSTLVHQRGDEWVVDPVPATRFLELLPPLVGETKPRLATLAENGIDVLVDGVVITQAALEGMPVPPDTVFYRGATAVDHDRSGRNRVLLTRQQSTNRTVLELTLDEAGQLEAARELGVASDYLVGGDVNHDGYPDLAAWFNNVYRTLPIVPSSPVSIVGQLETPVSGDTPNGTLRKASPPVWVDLDDDHDLDLVLTGSQLRIVLADDTGVGLPVLPPLDCIELLSAPAQTPSADPPMTPAMVPCTTTNLVAAALPRRGAPTELVIGTHDPIDLRTSTGTLGRYRLVDGALVREQAITCPNCGGIVALLARDVDGDHELDIIAFDATMRMIVARSAEGYLGRVVSPSPITLPANVRVRDVRISASSFPGR